MKKITYIIFSFFCFQVCFAQGDSTKKNPRYKISVTTMNDNIMVGLLVGATDTSITIYPGSMDHFKRGKQFSNANYSYENIKEIKAKKKGAALRGAAIGTGIGMVPVIYGLISPGRGSTGYLGVLTVPVGALTGVLIGSLSSKKARIDGDKEKFKQFLTRID